MKAATTPLIGFKITYSEDYVYNCLARNLDHALEQFLTVFPERGMESIENVKQSKNSMQPWENVNFKNVSIII